MILFSLLSPSHIFSEDNRNTVMSAEDKLRCYFAITKNLNECCWKKGLYTLLIQKSCLHTDQKLALFLTNIITLELHRLYLEHVLNQDFELNSPKNIILNIIDMIIPTCSKWAILVPEFMRTFLLLLFLLFGWLLAFFFIKLYVSCIAQASMILHTFFKTVCCMWN